MIAYTLKCSSCRAKAEYREPVGRVLYYSADTDGWQWHEARGWHCPSCCFARVGQVVKRPVQTALI